MKRNCRHLPAIFSFLILAATVHISPAKAQLSETFTVSVVDGQPLQITFASGNVTAANAKDPMNCGSRYGPPILLNITAQDAMFFDEANKTFTGMLAEVVRQTQNACAGKLNRYSKIRINIVGMDSSNQRVARGSWIDGKLSAWTLTDLHPKVVAELAIINDLVARYPFLDRRSIERYQEVLEQPMTDIVKAVAALQPGQLPRALDAQLMAEAIDSTCTLLLGGSARLFSGNAVYLRLFAQIDATEKTSGYPYFQTAKQTGTSRAWKSDYLAARKSAFDIARQLAEQTGCSGKQILDTRSFYAAFGSVAAQDLLRWVDTPNLDFSGLASLSGNASTNTEANTAPAPINASGGALSSAKAVMANPPSVALPFNLATWEGVPVIGFRGILKGDGPFPSPCANMSTRGVKRCFATEYEAAGATFVNLHRLKRDAVAAGSLDILLPKTPPPVSNGWRPPGLTPQEIDDILQPSLVESLFVGGVGARSFPRDQFELAKSWETLRVDVYPPLLEWAEKLPMEAWVFSAATFTGYDEAVGVLGMRVPFLQFRESHYIANDSDYGKYRKKYKKNLMKVSPDVAAELLAKGKGKRITLAERISFDYPETGDTNFFSRVLEQRIYLDPTLKTPLVTVKP